MSQLRDKVVAELERIEGYRGLEHERQADAILAIPEIRDALVKGRDMQAERQRLNDGKPVAIRAGDLTDLEIQEIRNAKP